MFEELTRHCDSSCSPSGCRARRPSSLWSWRFSESTGISGLLSSLIYVLVPVPYSLVYTVGTSVQRESDMSTVQAFFILPLCVRCRYVLYRKITSQLFIHTVTVNTHFCPYLSPQKKVCERDFVIRWILFVEGWLVVKNSAHSSQDKIISYPVLRIRIRRIRMFLDLPDPDPLLRCKDPDPSNIKQK